MLKMVKKEFSECIRSYGSRRLIRITVCSIKKAFLKFSQISQENTCIGVSFDKVAGLRRFPVKFVNFFNKTYFAKHLRTSASELCKTIFSFV